LSAESDWWLVADLAKENIAAREKKFESSIVPRLARLVWKAPKNIRV